MIGEKIKRLLNYGGIKKEVFMNLADDISESNRKSLHSYSLILSVGMACMFIASFFAASLLMGSATQNRIAYLCALVVGIVLYFFSGNIGKGRKKIILIGVYAFTAMLFAFGIYLGTIVEPNQMSVSFAILLFAAPLLFTDVPIRMSIALMVGIACYCAVAIRTQSSVMYGYNMMAILPYGAISIILQCYMMQIKYSRHALEYENRFLIESDQLTGMLNRRSYEQHLHLLREKGLPKGALVCAFDVNGLKRVNDNIGHHAGDELIRGASSCIKGVYGPYGRVYRIGGDEFMAIIENVSPLPEELREQLEMRCSCFTGSYVSGLSISVGTATVNGSTSIDEIVKEADQNMYEDKRLYYERTGIDRRRG